LHTIAPVILGAIQGFIVELESEVRPAESLPG